MVNRHEWDLLDALRSDRTTVGEVFDAYRHRGLDALRSRLGDADLSAIVEPWLAVHAAKVAPDTVNHYRVVLRRLMPEGERFPASRFSIRELEPWLAAYPGGNETRRKAFAALSQFAKFCRRQGALGVNPLHELKRSRPNAPRLRYLEVERMIALADAQPEPYQSLCAFLHGTGADLSTALTLTAADVDLSRKEVRARGTKTHARDRIVRVAEWAWPYVVSRVATVEREARLFPVDRWRAQDAHNAACKAIGESNYWLRDARHSYAVRAARAGTPAELIAKQLGHADATMELRVYGRFMSDAADRDRWELRAAVMDAERWKELSERGTTPIATPQKSGEDATESTKPPTRWSRRTSEIAGEGLEPSTPAL